MPALLVALRPLDNLCCRPRHRRQDRLIGIAGNSKSPDDEMKGNPAAPGGPLTSKPTWSITSSGQPRRFFIGLESVGRS